MSDIKKRTTEKIMSMVDEAINNKPNHTVDIRFVENYHHSVGAFGTHNCWTAIDCIYTNQNGETIKRIEALKHGDWNDSDMGNYILYNRGYHAPNELDSLGCLKKIKNTYDTNLNYGIIDPIDNLYSTTYTMKLICDEIIENNLDDIVLTFILDYDYAENRTDMKWKKKEYSFQCQITYGDKQYTTDYLWDTNAHMLMGKIYNKLIDHVNHLIISYDMLDDDRIRFENGHNWTDITF